VTEHPQEYVDLDFSEWPSLWVEVSVAIANAPYAAFVEQAFRLGVRVAKGLLTVVEAADALQAAAHYNQLPFHYGADRLQAIMSEAFKAASKRRCGND
jgi:hypothetical protein